VGVSTSGSNVTGWADQSGAGNDWNDISTTPPTLEAGGVSIGATDRYIGRVAYGGGVLTSTELTYFLVCSPGSSGALRTMAHGGNLASSARTRFDNSSTYLINAGSNLSGGSSDTNFHIFSILFTNTGNDRLYVDGTLVLDGSAGDTAGQGGFWIGRASNASVSTFKAIIVYDRLVNDTERGQIRSYLQSRYPGL
jgi:hypothetical protein